MLDRRVKTAVCMCSLPAWRRREMHAGWSRDRARSSGACCCGLACSRGEGATLKARGREKASCRLAGLLPFFMSSISSSTWQSHEQDRQQRCRCGLVRSGAC